MTHLHNAFYGSVTDKDGVTGVVFLRSPVQTDESLLDHRRSLPAQGIMYLADQQCVGGDPQKNLTVEVWEQHMKIAQ